MCSIHSKLLAAALAAACLAAPALLRADEAPPEDQNVGAATVTPLKDSELSRVTLTEKAAARLDIQTAELRKEANGQLVVPYSSVIYDTTGGTWVFASPEKLTFVRQNVVIDLIKGDDAFLKEGPAAGTQVATSGVSELLGIEKGVGEE